MPQLTEEELRREYRAALRREVQLRQRVNDLEVAFLRMKGKLMGNIQEIDIEVEQSRRQQHQHAVSHAIEQHDNRRLGPIEHESPR